MNFCPEDQLLILCAKTYFDEDDLAIISHLLKQNLDWDYLISASIQHGVALLLYNSLSIATDNFNQTKQNSAYLPDTVKAELENLYLNNHRRTRRMHRVMAEIFKAFWRQNIAVMALKELGLIQFAYPEASLRPIGDLDLLIHKHAFRGAEKCLNTLGFRPLPAVNCYYQMTYDAECQFQRPADNVWLDLQWDIENKEMDIYGEGCLNFEVDRMWQNARSIQIAGCDVLIPSPADMLFHLCLHLEGHGYTELILLTDIAEAIRTYGDDLVWDELIALAQKYGVEATVYYVLLWVKTLFNSPIPARVFEALTPPYFKAHLFEALFGNLIPLHGHLDEIALVAVPPIEVMKQFESIARRQTVGAMRLYQVVEKTMLAFKAVGGQIAILNGKTSSVVFPSTALPAFNPLQLLIVADDLPALTATLQNSGFENQGEDTLWRRFVVQSKEAALADQPFNLTVKWHIQTDKQTLFNRPLSNNRLSKKGIATHIIKDALNKKETNPNLDVEVTIHVYPLLPEEMLVLLCLETTQVKSELLASCNLLDFFRVFTASRPIDWEIFVEIISSHQPQSVERIYSNLIIAYNAVDPTGQVAIEHGLNLLQVRFPEAHLPSIRPRLFARARRGADSLSQSEALLKNSFFMLLVFLSIPKARARLAYMGRLIFSIASGRKSLFRLGWLTANVMLFTLRLLGLKKEKIYSAKDFVYWIE